MKSIVVLALAFVLAASTVALALDKDVGITPHHLSLSGSSHTRFVRCNVSSEYQVANPAACSLAIDGAAHILAVKVESHIEEHDTTVVFFYFNDVVDMLSEAEAMGEVELTLTIEFSDGPISWTDTIVVVE